MAKCKDCTHYLTCRQGKSNPDYCGQFMNYKNTVEVVRCKDCKHYKPMKPYPSYNGHTNYCCRCASTRVADDDFCSYGERKE